MDVEKGEVVVVGMNKFKVEEKAPQGLLKVDPLVGEMQKKKLVELRERRNNQAVSDKLSALKKACEGTENVMPYILEAVREYATLGEICDVMREVFGEYEQSVML